MYAVIKAGGKQMKVKAGDVIEVELIHGGHDEEVTFTPLLVVDDEGTTHVGKALGKAQVRAKLVGEKKGSKIKVFKYKSKSGYSRRQGHRQTYTLAEVLDISLGRRAAAKKAAKAEPAPAEESTGSDEPSVRGSVTAETREPDATDQAPVDEPDAEARVDEPGTEPPPAAEPEAESPVDDEPDAGDEGTAAGDEPADEPSEEPDVSGDGGEEAHQEGAEDPDEAAGS